MVRSATRCVRASTAPGATTLAPRGNDTVGNDSPFLPEFLLNSGFAVPDAPASERYGTAMPSPHRVSHGPVSVAALYRFTRLEDAASLCAPLERLCRMERIRGTLLLASEGINGTIAGSPEAIALVLAHIRALPDCAELDVKLSTAETMPFHRMKVRLKREIV